jgi:hypothetical protein
MIWVLKYGYISFTLLSLPFWNDFDSNSEIYLVIKRSLNNNSHNSTLVVVRDKYQSWAGLDFEKPVAVDW